MQQMPYNSDIFVIINPDGSVSLAEQIKKQFLNNSQAINNPIQETIAAKSITHQSSQPLSISHSYDIDPALKYQYPGDTWRYYASGTLNPGGSTNFKIIVRFNQNISTQFMNNFTQFIKNKLGKNLIGPIVIGGPNHFYFTVNQNITHMLIEAILGQAYRYFQSQHNQ